MTNITTQLNYQISYCHTVDSQHLLNTKSFSCDIETTSLIPEKGKIRLIQIYLPKIKTVVLIPFDFENSRDKNEKEGFKNWISALLKQLYNRQVLKIWHNALFDVGWFYFHYGVLSVNNFDTMIASQIHKAGKFYGYKKVFSEVSPNSLGFLCQESGYEHDKTLQKSDWSEALTEDQMIYGARDAYYTFVLARQYFELLSYCPMVVAAEMGAISVFVYMNSKGLQVNLETLKNRVAEYSSKADELLKFLESKITLDPHSTLDWYQDYYEKKGLPKKLDTPEKLAKECKKVNFAPGSFQSVAKWLYSFVPDRKILHKIDKKTGNRQISTAKGTLFSVYEQTKNQDLLTLIQYRSIDKAASTFKSYLNSYDYNHQSVYASYSILAIQGTGRSSSGRKAAKGEDIKYCNVQNWSKHLVSHQKHGLKSTRSCVQSKEGYVLAEFDVAASHIQWARLLSQDASLIESNNSGLKIHYFTLAGILKHSDGLNVSPEETKDLVEGKADKSRTGYYKQLYKLAKNVIYSFLNYAGRATLQGQFFNNEVFVSLDDCALYLDACADQFSGLRRFQDKKFETVKRTLQPLYVEGKYIGHYAKSHHVDGAITYHAAKRKQSNRIIEVFNSADGDDIEIDVTEEYFVVPSKKDMYLKISDIVAACWLRPEATFLKNACAKVFDYQLESGLPFNFVNFSHDSFMLDIRKDVVEEVSEFAFNTLNTEYQTLIPDYKPEGTAMDCVLGKMWERE